MLEAAAGAVVLHALVQVHGNEVRVVCGEPRPPVLPPGDALLTRTPGVGVAVKVADCAPVLLADPSSGAVAGAHAGWRGAVAGIAGKTARALARAADSFPQRLIALIGPAIRSCCLEIGPEVIAALAAAGRDPERITRRPARPGERPHLDLPLENRRQLLEAGLRPAAIHDCGLCTRCHPAFHSYRREGPRVGRNWAFAVATRGEAGLAPTDEAPDPRVPRNSNAWR